MVAALAAGPASAADEVRYRSMVSGPTGLPPACGRARIESNPTLAVTPGDARRLGLVWHDHGGDAAVGARSDDGGRTWERLAVPDAVSCQGGPAGRGFLFNPYVAMGPQGDLWFGNSAGGSGGPRVLGHRWVSGAGWTAPLALDPERPAQDAPVLPDAVRRDRARFVWTRYTGPEGGPFGVVPVTDALMTATTVDGGLTASAPTVVEAAAPGEFHDNPVLLRASDGALVLIVRRPEAADLGELFLSLAAPRPLVLDVDVLRSTDDGATWSKVRGVATATLHYIADPDGDAEHVNGLTDAAAGPDGLVAFIDAPPAQGGVSTILLTLSADGGRTWQPSQETIRRSAPILQPSVAIGPDGSIGLSWYDLRNDRPGDDTWTMDAWFAISRDGGATWRETHLAGPMDLRDAFEPGQTYDGGPLGVNQDLVALPDGFGATFTAARPVATEGRTDIVYARVGSRRLRITTTPRTITPRGRRTVRVRVIDDAGRPVAGARVRALGATARTSVTGIARLRLRRAAKARATPLRVKAEERRARLTMRVRQGPNTVP